MQIVRIDDSPEFYLERTMLAGQRLVFEAPAHSSLKIHSHALASAIFEDTIPCQQLQETTREMTVVELQDRSRKRAA